jgi:hypothetical protein
MPRLARFALALALVAIPWGCKRQGAGETRPGSKAAGVVEKRPPGMPRPLALPAQPDAAWHVAQPAELLAFAAHWAGRDGDGRDLFVDIVAAQMPGFAAQVARHVDLQRPWDAAVIDGQTIVHVPVLRAQTKAVAALLADKPPSGRFGAVELQAQSGPKLAYLDADAAYLTLADDLHGIATGRELPRAYGKKPLWGTLAAEQARRWLAEFPVARVTIAGAGLHEFVITTEGTPQNVPQLQQLTEGALTGLLEAEHIAVGASSRYAKYQELVKSWIGRATRIVDDQNFLVRGTLEELLGRGNAVLRRWDGRVLVALGPSRHVLVALGTDDPLKASKATLHLVDGVIDNLELARSFGIGVPKLKFKRNRAQGAGIDVHAVALMDARKMIPPYLSPLLDDDGNLRVGFAFAPRAGGALVAIGPQGADVVARWLEQTAGATPGKDSLQDFVAATIAVDPEAVAPLLDGDGEPDPGLFALQPGPRPTRIVVRRDDGGLVLAVKGPRFRSSRRTPPAKPAVSSAAGSRRRPPAG